MLQRRLTTNTEALGQIFVALTGANLDFLCHCVGFWLAVKPNCGVKDWLEYSIRRSTHRLATDGLHETIVRLSDDDLIWLHQSRAAEIRNPSCAEIRNPNPRNPNEISSPNDEIRMRVFGKPQPCEKHRGFR